MDGDLIPYGTVISYDNGVIKGNGIIVGLSSKDIPIIGVGYIVKDLSGNIPSDVFKYDTFIVFSIHIKELLEK